MHKRFRERNAATNVITIMTSITWQLIESDIFW